MDHHDSSMRNRMVEETDDWLEDKIRIVRREHTGRHPVNEADAKENWEPVFEEFRESH